MRRFSGIRNGRSGEMARSRLKLLLTAERSGCSPELIEMLKEDLCHILRKYMEVDDKELEVGVKTLTCGSNNTVSALYANIPIHSLTYKGMF